MPCSHGCVHVHRISGGAPRQVRKALRTRYAFRTMAELQIAPARSSGNGAALFLAALVLAAIAAAVFYFNPHKVAELRVTGVDTYAPQTSFSALSGTAQTHNGMHILDAPATSTETNLYVIANVNLTDKLRLPLFINGATARVTMADGSEMEANLLSASDLQRLGVIFPEIRQRAVAPLSDGDEVAPGQTRVGTLVLPFPGQTAAAWQSKKQATLTIQLRNQDPQTTVLP